jgi:hypothetical protein
MITPAADSAAVAARRQPSIRIDFGMSYAAGFAGTTMEVVAIRRSVVR